ncbi:hypothetical protein DFH11DRAFT_1204408 [Phellopilus nigrolimitatus]|nr:hypothetical protein DFH11DRAFT_1204408 [Phellopilus nigrolimitatus]
MKRLRTNCFYLFLLGAGAWARCGVSDKVDDTRSLKPNPESITGLPRAAFGNGQQNNYMTQVPDAPSRPRLSCRRK